MNAIAAPLPAAAPPGVVIYLVAQDAIQVINLPV
jgi:hypothetical protein